MDPKSELVKKIHALYKQPPRFETSRVGGPDHLPTWKTTVILPNGESYSGYVADTKMIAERFAAEVALYGIENILIVGEDSSGFLSAETRYPSAKCLTGDPVEIAYQLARELPDRVVICTNKEWGKKLFEMASKDMIVEIIN